MRLGLALALAGLAACGTDGNSDRGSPDAVVQTTAISGESRMLSGTQGQPLMHPVSAVQSVYSYGSDGTRVEYSEGVDFVVEGDTIRRTANSSMPDYASYSFTRNPDGLFSFTSDPRNPPRTIQLATYIDYRAAIAPPVVAAKELPRTPTNVVCLGDSITHAADTVAFFFRDSADDGWCAHLSQFMAERGTVTLPAEKFGFLRDVAPTVIDSLSPDIDTVILAFGMNDQLAGEDGQPAFRDLLRTTVRDLRKSGRNVILVGFFQQNKLWDLEQPADTLLYNETIEVVASSQGVPFVDMYTAMREAAPASQPVFEHVTGDFLHHPNNYGQKIYFSQIVPYFLRGNTRSDKIPNYIPGPWSER